MVMTASIPAFAMRFAFIVAAQAGADKKKRREVLGRRLHHPQTIPADRNCPKELSINRLIADTIQKVEGRSLRPN
jgi:hypothetical protein